MAEEKRRGSLNAMYYVPSIDLKRWIFEIGFPRTKHHHTDDHSVFGTVYEALKHARSGRWLYGEKAQRILLYLYPNEYLARKQKLLEKILTRRSK
ncbi:MAG: hypothetical protein HW383_66 [Candidatus Magasanikbacteria bacterium]|nr:hypothetical protein [Candidatus Magasanikbacteria bacterium]